MLPKKLALLFLSLAPICVWSLPNNSLFETDKTIDSEYTRQLYFRIESTNFVKNNEYFNRFTEGYTLLGFMARPKLVYFPSPSTKIEAGAHILKYSGLNTKAQATPLLSFTHAITDELKLVLGTLHGALDHGMIEPIYRIENHFENNLENGVQFLYRSEHFRSDLWVNWERFIFQGDPFKEEFSFGWVNNLDFDFKNSPTHLTIPLHFYGVHRGGQIDTSGDPLQTRGNLMTGLSLSLVSESAMVNRAGVNALYFVYNDLSPILSYPYRRGHAYYATAYANIGDFQLDIGYWRGYQFMAPRGEPSFQSVSQVSEYTQPTRTLLTAKIGFQHEIYEDILFSARFEPYYDLDLRRLDYSTAIYLTFNRSFFLKQL